MNNLIQRLRSGTHNEEPVTVGGVEHDKRCLEAADEIEHLEVQLAVARNDTLDEVNQWFLDHNNGTALALYRAMRNAAEAEYRNRVRSALMED